MTQQWECWAYVSPHGKVLADLDFNFEHDAWYVALGWPDNEEIQAAKQRGARVIRVRIEEIET